VTGEAPESGVASAGDARSGDPLVRDGEPTRIGRFVVLHRLGSGGMGLVYAAYDAELDRKVAIKLLRPHVAHSGRATLGQARLLREAQAMARLSHPNVVTVHEVGTFGDQVFIAMEFLEGITLKAWLRKARRGWREVVAVFLQAGRGLQAAHAAGLIHRDFKPDNVMVSEDHRTGEAVRVRVFDFGVVQEVREAALRTSGDALDVAAAARRTPNPDPEDRRSSGRSPSSQDVLGRARVRGLPSHSSPGLPQIDDTPLPSPLPSSLPDTSVDSITDLGSLTAAGALVGTPMYMAPEQYQQTADARSDQFSFCAALFEGLYRKRPYAGDTAAALQRAKLAGRVRSRPRDSAVPQWLHHLTMRGLSAEPAQRFPDMTALLAELARDRGRRRRIAWAGLTLAAAVGLGAGTMYMLSADDPCEGAAAEVAAAWSPARRAAIRDAFLASGRSYAAETFATVDAALSRHAAAWVGQRRDLCVHSDPAAQAQLAARAVCLDLRLRELAALTEQLARADGDVVDHAPGALGELTPVDVCDDAVALLSRSPPPPPPRLAPVVDAIEDRLAEIRALEQTGKYAAGLIAARAAVAEARRLEHPPWLAEALLLEGTLQAHLGSLRAAEAALFEASVAAEASRHDLVLARAWIELVRVVGGEQERFDEGQRYAQLADAVVQRLGGGPEAVALAGHLGRLHARRGDLAAAAREFERAHKMAVETLPEEHPLQATANLDLGGHHLAGGRHDDAARAYAAGLALRRAVFGADHPRVAEALSLSARAAAASGDRERARELAGEALRICEGPGRCGPSARGDALLDLARIELAAGHLEGGQILAERALELFTATYGPAHTRVAECRAELGEFARRLARDDEARAHLERALEIFRRHDGEHPGVRPLLIRLGDLALAQRRWTDAREHFRDAQALGAGREDQGLAALLDGDGLAARHLGDPVTAVARHTRALAILTRDRGDADPDVVRVRTHLAEAHLAAGEPALAVEVAGFQLAALARTGAEPPELPRLRALVEAEKTGPRGHGQKGMPKRAAQPHPRR
jgi:serine/threonine protein kinase/tetratricopeptide (TPR) repeat protein